MARVRYAEHMAGLETLYEHDNLPFNPAVNARTGSNFSGSPIYSPPQVSHARFADTRSLASYTSSVQSGAPGRPYAQPQFAPGPHSQAPSSQAVISELYGDVPAATATTRTGTTTTDNFHHPLENQDSSSTLRSHYEASKLPLYITQQTSASSMRDGALRKGLPRIDVADQQPPPSRGSTIASKFSAATSTRSLSNAWKRPSRLDIAKFFPKPKTSSAVTSPLPPSSETGSSLPVPSGPARSLSKFLPKSKSTTSVPQTAASPPFKPTLSPTPSAPEGISLAGRLASPSALSVVSDYVTTASSRIRPSWNLSRKHSKDSMASSYSYAPRAMRDDHDYIVQAKTHVRRPRKGIQNWFDGYLDEEEEDNALRAQARAMEMRNEIDDQSIPVATSPAVRPPSSAGRPPSSAGAGRPGILKTSSKYSSPSAIPAPIGNHSRGNSNVTAQTSSTTSTTRAPATWRDLQASADLRPPRGSSLRPSTSHSNTTKASRIQGSNLQQESVLSLSSDEEDNSDADARNRHLSTVRENGTAAQPAELPTPSDSTPRKHQRKRSSRSDRSRIPVNGSPNRNSATTSGSIPIVNAVNSSWTPPRETAAAGPSSSIPRRIIGHKNNPSGLSQASEYDDTSDPHATSSAYTEQGTSHASSMSRPMSLASTATSVSVQPHNLDPRAAATVAAALQDASRMMAVTKEEEALLAMMRTKRAMMVRESFAEGYQKALHEEQAALESRMKTLLPPVSESGVQQFPGSQMEPSSPQSPNRGHGHVVDQARRGGRHPNASRNSTSAAESPMGVSFPLPPSRNASNDDSAAPTEQESPVEEKSTVATSVDDMPSSTTTPPSSGGASSNSNGGISRSHSKDKKRAVMVPNVPIRISSRSSANIDSVFVTKSNTPSIAAESAIVPDFFTRRSSSPPPPLPADASALAAYKSARSSRSNSISSLDGLQSPEHQHFQRMSDMIPHDAMLQPPLDDDEANAEKEVVGPAPRTPTFPSGDFEEAQAQVNPAAAVDVASNTNSALPVPVPTDLERQAATPSPHASTTASTTTSNTPSPHPSLDPLAGTTSSPANGSSGSTPLGSGAGKVRESIATIESFAVSTGRMGIKGRGRPVLHLRAPPKKSVPAVPVPTSTPSETTGATPTKKKATGLRKRNQSITSSVSSSATATPAAGVPGSMAAGLGVSTAEEDAGDDKSTGSDDVLAAWHALGGG